MAGHVMEPRRALVDAFLVLVSAGLIVGAFVSSL